MRRLLLLLVLLLSFPLLAGPRARNQDLQKADLVDDASDAVLLITIDDPDVSAGTLQWVIYAFDGTPDYQTRSGLVEWRAHNEGGTVTAAISTVADYGCSCDVGTLTATWAIAAGADTATISVTANSSLGAPLATGNLRLEMRVEQLTPSSIKVQ